MDERMKEQILWNIILRTQKKEHSKSCDVVPYDPIKLVRQMYSNPLRSLNVKLVESSRRHESNWRIRQLKPNSMKIARVKSRSASGPKESKSYLNLFPLIEVKHC